MNDDEERRGLTLRRASSSSSFKIKNTPLHLTSKVTQQRILDLCNREPLMRAFGKQVVVSFEDGPLGLQLADVGSRVLVTALEHDDDTGESQAQQCGKIEVGNQIVAVAGKSCIGLPMRKVLEYLQNQARPIEITFQPLVIPHFPSKDKPTIYDTLGNDKTLESSGTLFDISFSNEQLGVNVGNWSDANGDRIVIVSQLLDDSSTFAGRLSLGDRVVCVKDPNRSDKENARDLVGKDYTEIAGFIRHAPRPLTITFEKMIPVLKSEISARKRNIKKLQKKKKIRCDHCNKCVYETAKYCWKCGNQVNISTDNNITTNLLSFDENDDENSNHVDFDFEPQVYSNFANDPIITDDSSSEQLLLAFETHNEPDVFDGLF